MLSLPVRRVAYTLKTRPLICEQTRQIGCKDEVKRRMPINPLKIKKILICRSGTIGDTIVAVPAIHLLRCHFKEASFILMTANNDDGKMWADVVLKEFGWFETFLTYSYSDLRGPISVLRHIRKVRSLNPDMVIHMASDRTSGLKIWRDRLFFLLAGVRTFVPHPSPKITFWGRLKKADKIYPKEVVRLVEDLRKLGIDQREISFELPVQDRHVRRVSDLIQEAGIDPHRPLIGMCPWSKQETSRWPLERYAKLGERLIKKLNVNIAIVLGRGDTEVAQNVSLSWPTGRWATFAGSLTVLEAAELLRRCLFYVGNDTGPMHLAAAVGTPCVALFSGRQPAESWYPFGHQHIVLRKNVSCRNCYRRTCDEYNLRCLTEITLEEVWAACKRMFRSRGGIASGPFQHNPPF